jgi:murein DD-endopeptidase MepM/ murein hydrolase activator NlpD
MPRAAVVPGSDQTRRITAYVLVLGLLGLAAAVPPAGAQSPGGAQAGDPAPAATPAPSSTPARGPSTGGAPAAPRLTALRCRSRCAGPAAARPGGTLDLRGRAISSVESVLFLGRSGAGDDVSVLPRKVTRKRILVRVPRLAHTGPVAVVNRDGAESSPSPTALTVSAGGPEAAPPGGPLIDVELQDPKVFFDGLRKATLVYVLRGSEPASIDVELVRPADGAVVQRWSPGLATPGEPRTVAWDGTVSGRPQPPGRYEFRVTATDGTGVRATSAQAAGPGAADPDAFDFLDHQFPIRGRHTMGTGAAAFGGGRGHQGHDVFAACGTPLVAARGGKVKFRQYHARAGHYLVIDGEQTDVDYAYMHLRDPALVAAGARVRTGQLLGYVGDTGRAHGCHLHFELWSGPGWYDGGQPLDPLPFLRAWDASS